MKNIIIVSAGSYAREVLLCIKWINKRKPTWNILGFIDDNPDALAGIKCDYKIIGTIQDYIPKEDEYFALGIADPHLKDKIVTLLKSKGAKFATIINPNVSIGDYVEIGEGVVILGSNVGSNAILGNFTSIMGSMIGQDSIIGDFSTTTGYVNIASATLGEKVFVGSHAVVLNHLSVGDDAVVGAGSIVIRNVKAGTTVFGNPAKRIY